MAAGALKPRKGYHTTLEALPTIRERYPDVHYYLVGDDQDRKYVAGLRETIDRLDLDAQRDDHRHHRRRLPGCAVPPRRRLRPPGREQRRRRSRGSG